jgi:hypothetical protein
MKKNSTQKSEALLTHLSSIGALKVIARSSVMGYEGTEKPLVEIVHTGWCDPVDAPQTQPGASAGERTAAAGAPVVIQ